MPPGRSCDAHSGENNKSWGGHGRKKNGTRDNPWGWVPRKGDIMREKNMVHTKQEHVPGEGELLPHAGVVKRRRASKL